MKFEPGDLSSVSAKTTDRRIAPSLRVVLTVRGQGEVLLITVGKMGKRSLTFSTVIDLGSKPNVSGFRTNQELRH